MDTIISETPITSITHALLTQNELNLSYMPFITNGGLFILTQDDYNLGTRITLNLTLPTLEECTGIETKVIWINPKNSTTNAYPGIGLQFIGKNAPEINERIKNQLDNTAQVGGYAYGTTS